MRVAFALLVLLSGCIRDSTFVCGTERCNADLVCTPGGCATVEAATACVDAVETEECDVAGVAGVCLGGACQPTICGDGRLDRSEACEDSNTFAGDGCSATCDSTEVCGNEVIDLVAGEECDAGPAQRSGDGCSSRCRLEQPSWVDVSPRPIVGRAAPGAATHLVQGYVIVFGGATTTELLDDTWIRRNALWERLDPPRSPPPRSEPAMTYDAKRDRVVLFGGLGANGALGDTWEWNGTTWTEVLPPTSPPPRRGAVLVYDEDLERVALIGGLEAGESVDDVWEFDGVTWTLAAPSPGQKSPSATWDDADGSIFYFGGGETWRRDQGTWSKLVTATIPDVSGYATIGFDPATERIVMFGGLDSTGAYLASTWVWDGADWSAPQQTIVPAARSLAVSFHEGQRLELFGGFYQGAQATVFRDVFVWEGGWMYADEALDQAPAARSHAAAVDEPTLGRIRLYGGAPYRGDEWFWRDSIWVASQTRIPKPPAREGARMARDARGNSVYFGGVNNSITFADTWTDNDFGSWRFVTPATSPTPRAFHGMAFDGARVILFGGEDGAELRGDTLAWTGSTWQTLSPPISPSPRSHMLMIYDEARDRIVLYGGSDASGVLGDTWEFDGATWHLIPTSTSPGPREDYSMAYDPQRQRIVLFGGSNAVGSRYGDTWEWDGTTWTEIVFATSPPVRIGAMLVYEAARRRMILFGGFGLAEGLADTWALVYTTQGAAGERCKLDEDRDGDGAAGCDDVDCWGRCTPLCAPLMTCAPDLPRCGDGACNVEIEDYLICPADCIP